MKKYTQKIFKKKKLPKTIHCCSSMDYIFQDQRIPLEYIPVFREYIVPATYAYQGDQIFYCSWCGAKLPSSVRENYFNTLKKEFNIPTTITELAAIYHHLPSEFKSDKWWKKRKL